MKTQPRIIITTVAAAFALARCKPPQSGIFILPQNNKEHGIIEAHWKEIQKLLEGKDDIYYVNDYHRGQLVGEKGKLDPILRVYETEQPKITADFTGHAFQIGVGLAPLDFALRTVGQGGEVGVILATVGPKGGEWPHLHLNRQITESQDLIKKVEDELNKPEPSPEGDH
jgi:hypothetical protein